MTAFKAGALSLRALVARNCKLFFRDKGTFLPSLLSPLILLFLFIAFLGNVYRDSIRSVLEGVSVTGAEVESIASGWLVSSLVAVCAVTVAFTANTIMVQDRAGGQADDIFVTPVPRPVVYFSYFLSTYLVTAAICFVALGAGFVYMTIAGWHLSAADFFLALADTLLLVFFGTALSSLVCRFLRTQGAVVAIQATVSAAYGFLCGAYIPIGNMAGWLGDLISCLPATYGTVLLHAHLMGGAIGAVGGGLPPALIAGLEEGFDCTVSFFGHAVPEWGCYLVLALACMLLAAVFLGLCFAEKRGRRGRGGKRKKDPKEEKEA